MNMVDWDVFPYESNVDADRMLILVWYIWRHRFWSEKYFKNFSQEQNFVGTPKH